MTQVLTRSAGEPCDGEVVWGSCCRVGDEVCAPAAPIPWLRLAIGLFVAAQTMTLAIAINHTPPGDHVTRLWLQGGMLAVTLLVMALLGLPLAREAIRMAWQRRISMEALFVVCLLGTFTLSCFSLVRGEGPVYFEVVSILLIVYSVGRAITTHSRGKALATLRELSQSLSTARQITIDEAGGEIERDVDVTSLAVGDHVRVLPGELIPVDGRIERGEAFVRESAFTGEWVPRTRGPRESVVAGTICEDGALTIAVTQAGGRRRLDDLALRIEAARQSPTSLQRQADRFVAWFLPMVMTVSLSALVFWTWWADLPTALLNALAVLLVACPCAAGLATPLAVWSVIGQLARRGLVVQSGEAIERFASADSVVFDKTGTLGDERLVAEFVDLPDEANRRREVLAIIAAVERHSDHPVARALRDVDADVDGPRVDVQWCRAVPGKGVVAKVTLNDGPLRGPAREHDVDIRREEGGDAMIAVAIDGDRVARVRIHERLRETASEAIDGLSAAGLASRIMTGDGWKGAEHVQALAPTTASMTPEAKHEAIDALREREGDAARPIFVGDGLNDAAAMAASHASIAMARGSDVAIETADATLHGDDLRLVPEAVRLARRAVHTVRSNLHWAVTYNLIGMTLAAIGWLDPIVAALLMTFSSGLVSWRSFHATGALSEEGASRRTPARSPSPSPAAPRSISTDIAAAMSASSTPRTIKLKRALHWTGMIGQAVLLIIIAELGIAGSVATLGAFVGLTWLALRWWPRMPAWADMVFGMVTVGGLGMNFGWWADLGFTNAIGPGHAHACCATMASEHPGIGLLTWMNLGMLALGVPAMYLLRYRPERWRWNRWCCSGMLVLGVPGMVFGMMAGSIMAMQWFEGIDPTIFVIVHYVAMMLGMCVGMLAPHFIELLAPLDRLGFDVEEYRSSSSSDAGSAPSAEG